MKTNLKLLMIMAALTGISSCGPQYQEPTEGSDIGFALSYFQKVNETVKYDENLIVSPYSAGVALSMLAEGAEGETKAEFADALNGCLFKAEDLGGAEDLIVKSANSIWVDDNFSLRNRYVDLLEKDFDAFITTQNFADPATVKAINSWCAENTEGKISKIIDELGRGTVMVLMNALYFNAPWEYAFDPAQTTDKVFHGISGDSEVPMMTRKARFMYAEYQGCQMVRLPYNGERYAMYIVLPPANMDVNSVIPYISESAYDAVMGMLAAGEVIVEMPKFKLEASFLLNDALEKMGIQTAFSGAADFSGISAMGPLSLSQVKQKCYIDVSEKGTEAAAVTSAQVRLTSVAPSRVMRMTVDRPFLFFIADTQAENILFAGKIVDL
ncbi:MAG: serpin family protein [Bacteroidales bacterium]|nr:serpin family protein [Bacteroidales bacterium]